MAGKVKAGDGPTRPCAHKRTTHQHGTRDGYVLDRCRCEPCRKANTAYAQQLRKRRAYGRIDLVDAQPVREHVEALRAAGVGLKSQATATGVHHSQYSRLVYGRSHLNEKPTQRMRSANAKAMLSLTLTQYDRLPGRALVPADGTRRRVQALATLGWSVTALARMLGRAPENLHLSIRSDLVTAATAREVRALYDRLWSTPAPAGEDRATRSARSKVIAAARRKGWVPPLAWDDATIDNPDAVPDLGGKPGDTLVEDYLDLRRSEEPWMIPSRLGYKDADGLRNALRKRGRDDLACTVKRTDRVTPEKESWVKAA